MTVAEAVPVAVQSQSARTAEYRRHIAPLLPAAAHCDGLFRRDRLARARAFETADVVRKLEVIGIQIAVPIHLDVAAVLTVVLIHHGKLG